jgi:hypothetical protein
MRKAKEKKKDRKEVKSELEQPSLKAMPKLVPVQAKTSPPMPALVPIQAGKDGDEWPELEGENIDGRLGDWAKRRKEQLLDRRVTELEAKISKLKINADNETDSKKKALMNVEIVRLEEKLRRAKKTVADAEARKQVKGEKLISLAWLRENATNPDINLKAGRVYAFLATSNTTMKQWQAYHASKGTKPNVTAYLRGHLADDVDLRQQLAISFKTRVGVQVQKQGDKLVQPALQNPGILGSRMKTINGATVIVLEHDNLMPAK